MQGTNILDKNKLPPSEELSDIEAASSAQSKAKEAEEVPLTCLQRLRGWLGFNENFKESALTLGQVKKNLNKVRTWVVVSLLPGIWNHYRTFKQLEFDEANTLNHIYNLVFLVMTISALLTVWASRQNRLDVIYWGLIIIVVRNLCPLYGIAMDFE